MLPSGEWGAYSGSTLCIPAKGAGTKAVFGPWDGGVGRRGWGLRGGLVAQLSALCKSPAMDLRNLPDQNKQIDHL